jgi:hypothetical protein
MLFLFEDEGQVERRRANEASVGSTIHFPKENNMKRSARSATSLKSYDLLEQASFRIDFKTLFPKGFGFHARASLRNDA